VSLPFSRSEFLQVFADYNTAIWPLQPVAAGLGLLAIVVLYRRFAWADRLIAGILCSFWTMMAVGYQWMFFSTVNDAAHAFGILFLLAALAFFVEGVVRSRMTFDVVPGVRGWVAVLLVVYAFAVYPLIGLIVTHPYPETPLFGVAPCPTTIFTLGFLLLVRHPRPWLLAAVPLLWSVIGGSAAFILNVPQDLGLIAAAVLWIGTIKARPLRAMAN
jgi:hypothetical protein